MAADTASRIPAATTPNTPKACLAIDAPFCFGRTCRSRRVQLRGGTSKLEPLDRKPNLRALGRAPLPTTRDNLPRRRQRAHALKAIQHVAEAAGDPSFAQWP